MTTKHIIRDIKEYIRHPYAWPGGYPKTLILSDGECLCPKCAKENFRQVLEATKARDHSGWRADCVNVIYETDSPIECCNCNQNIEVAYPAN